MFSQTAVKYVVVNYMSQRLLSLFFHISLHIYLFSNSHKVIFFFLNAHIYKPWRKEWWNWWMCEFDYKVKGVKVKSWLCEQLVQAAGVGGVNDSQLRIHWFSNMPKMITSKGKITVFLSCWMETWWKRMKLGVWVAFTLEAGKPSQFTTMEK